MGREFIKTEPGFRLDLAQWRFEKGGFTYEGVAAGSGLSLNAVWKLLKGKSDPSTTTVKAAFIAMGLDTKYAMNFDLKETQFRRAVLPAAR
jgi:transcriptional regulator with XRE-family HTH domain